MFNFLKPKTLFEKYYKEINSLSVVKSSEYYKPITAAYVHVISDYFYLTESRFQQRIESAKNTFDILENKYLTKNEMSVFDTCVDLFGKIIRREIQARADWFLADRATDNPIINLHGCFGDLLYSSSYIFDYENAPILLRPITDVFSFATQFNNVLNITISYIDELKRS